MDDCLVSSDVSLGTSSLGQFYCANRFFIASVTSATFTSVYISLDLSAVRSPVGEQEMLWP